MLLNKIVNHGLCFWSVRRVCQYAKRNATIRAGVDRKHALFGVELAPETVALLGAYYSLLIHWNDRLHLVAPCSPEEFATRHVLESLLLLPHLPHAAKIADIGSGGGLPIIRVSSRALI